MILPIYAYGQPVLKKRASAVELSDPGLSELLEDMWETMYNASGVGLAAPQIGKSLRIFLVDTVQLRDEEQEDPITETGIKEAFLNPEILSEEGELWAYEEGCLSIPHIRGEVERPADIRIQYYNAEFEMQEATFSGVTARVIQHEYDHIEGKLFVDQLKPLKRRLINRKLDKIKKGQVQTDYNMRYVDTRR